MLALARLVDHLLWFHSAPGHTDTWLKFNAPDTFQVCLDIGPIDVHES